MIGYFYVRERHVTKAPPAQQDTLPESTITLPLYE